MDTAKRFVIIQKSNKSSFVTNINDIISHSLLMISFLEYKQQKTKQLSPDRGCISNHFI